MLVNVEELLEMQRRRNEINAAPFSEINWMIDGKPIHVTPEQAKEWKFTGLSNTSFIDTGAYLDCE